jgi:uncharacterized protein (DUF58 family)
VPVLASMGLLALWATVAHDSGLGWVQGVGALVAGALAVGLVAPGFAVGRVRVTAAGSPTDAVRGSTLHLRLGVSGPAELRALDPPGPAVLASGGGQVLLPCTPGRRGLVDRVTVQVASAAPFGILWWTRPVVVTLARPIAVAPRTGAPDARLVTGHPVGREPDGADPAPAARTALGAAAQEGEQRGVRPYAHGDRRHLVHWPATAHTGTLMVRESERAVRATTSVDGTLPKDPQEAENHAARVLGTVVSLLAQGVAVQLATVEGRGPVLDPVVTALDAGRRLARALPLPPAGTPAGGGPT